MMIDRRFWEGKKVLVTGHTGFKGAWLCETLLFLGADVAGYALAPEGSTNLFELLKLQDRMKSKIADVRNADHIGEMLINFKPEIIFHLAAQPLVLESYTRPRYTYETNVMGTVNLLEAVRQTSSVRSVVNITTDKVYKNQERQKGYSEDEELCGYDPYSNSKSCSELITFSYINSFFNSSDSVAVSTARAGNVIGGGDFAKDRIIPDCVRAALKKTDILIRNPDSIRPYQHVLECLSGYLLLAERQFQDKERYQGCYNFGPDEKDSLKTSELASIFCNLWNENQLEVLLKWNAFQEKGPHEATLLRLNCEKAKKVLGWKPIWGAHEAIHEVVDWTTQYQEGKQMQHYMESCIEDYLNHGNQCGS